MKKIISVFVSAIVLMSAAICVFAAESNDSLSPDFELNTDTILLINIDNDEVYFSKNDDVERVMASTTKIMTYIVTAEAVADLVNTKITIEQQPIDDVLEQDASMAGFQNHIGEDYSVLDVLYGLMVPSGCDAAQILAYYIGGNDPDRFVDMMNEKAKELGCEHTHFNDAHGLSDENHYTTAQDLYKITKYAMTMPYFKEIVSTEFYTLPGDTVPLVNTNYLIDEVNRGKYYYQYATGVKTGYTDLAGKCLVSTAKKGNTNIMCVALGAKYNAETNWVNYAMIDSVNLYEWAFDNFTDNIDISIEPEYKSVQIGETLKLEADITANDTKEVPVITWTSSNPEIAEVDENGIVTAHKLGEAKIKAETQTGNFDVCYVACGYYNGIDVTSIYGDYTSGKKEPINWKAVKDNGFDFAIIRAGWGWEDYPSQNDTEFVANVRGAVENGVPFGINFIAYAVDTETARLEAEYLIKEINEYIPEYKDFMALPVSYSMSDSQYSRFTEEQNTEIMLEFDRVMKENGYKTICYANKPVFKNMNVAALKKADIGIWYAYWPYKMDFSEKAEINGEFEPDLWQYISNAYFPSASDNLNTKQSVLYMSSSKYEGCQPPAVSAQQVVGEKAVKITWTKVPYDISGYSIYRMAKGSESLEKIADLDADVFEYTDTVLQWNDCYTYYVAAKANDDPLDKNYIKEIIGVCDTDVTVLEPKVESSEEESSNISEESSNMSEESKEIESSSMTEESEASKEISDISAYVSNDFPPYSIDTGSEPPYLLIFIVILSGASFLLMIKSACKKI